MLGPSAPQKASLAFCPSPCLAQASAQRRRRGSDRHQQRRTERGERLFDRHACDVRGRQADHWKISVVQSPP